MNCRQAEGLMDQVLDGALADRAALDAHLADCPRCAAEFARLQRLDRVLREGLRCPGDEAGLERVTAGVLGAVAGQGAAASSPPVWWAPMAAAALLAAFAVGILAGRAAFPREVPVTQVVTRPQVVERVVKVPVPVVRERVVVRNVPMVRTRVVYRDRPVPVTVPAVPVKVEQLVVPVDASAVTFRPVFVRELQPVTVVDRTQPAPESDGNRSGARGDLGEPRCVPAVRLAQWVRDGQ